jgi:hypothetical protein
VLRDRHSDTDGITPNNWLTEVTLRRMLVVAAAFHRARANTIMKSEIERGLGTPRNDFGARVPWDTLQISLEWSLP